MSDFANSLSDDEYGEIGGFPASDCSIIDDLANQLRLELKHWKNTGKGMPHLKMAAKEFISALEDEGLHEAKAGAVLKINGERKCTLQFCEKCGVDLKSNGGAVEPEKKL